MLMICVAGEALNFAVAASPGFSAKRWSANRVSLNLSGLSSVRRMLATTAVALLTVLAGRGGRSDNRKNDEMPARRWPCRCIQLIPICWPDRWLDVCSSSACYSVSGVSRDLSKSLIGSGYELISFIRKCAVRVAIGWSRSACQAVACTCATRRPARTTRAVADTASGLPDRR